MKQLLKTLGRRILQAICVSLLVSTLSFFMVRSLPGDMALRVAAGRYGYDLVSNAAADKVRAELRLDDPLPVALGVWLRDVIQFNLGRSMVSRQSVVEEVGHHLRFSICLALAAMAIAWLLGPAIGVVSGLYPRGLLDRLLMFGAPAIRAIPTFVVGVVLIAAFSVQFNALPAAGTEESTSVLLPASAIALGLMAGLSRVTRESIAAVTGSAYFSFARTKGLSMRYSILHHALRNAAIPVIAYTGVQMVFLIEGIIAVETLFAWPGIGHALVHAIFGRDVPMIQGSVLAMALLFVSLSAFVDLLILAVDPRRR